MSLMYKTETDYVFAVLSKRGLSLRNPRFFLQQIKKLGIEETCMGRQLVLHHTKTRSRSHTGHPILTQRAHPSTSLRPFSSSENVDVLCQRITSRTSAHSDGAWSIHARQGLPKHAIKRVDRLLGNRHLQTERSLFYWVMLRTLLGSLKHPLILVDWSPIDAA